MKRKSTVKSNEPEQEIINDHRIQLEPETSSKLDGIRARIIGYIWLFTLCAVPMWWNMTRVYRALPIAVVVHHENVASDIEKSLNAEYEGVSSLVPITFAISSGDSFWPESIVDFDAASLDSKMSEYHLYIHCDSDPSIVLGYARNWYLQLPSCTPEKVVSAASSLIAGLFVDEQLEYQSQLSSRSSDSPKDRRTIEYSSKYQVLLSLLVGNPEDGIVSWDAREAIQSYLEPLVKQLGHFSDFEFVSQILNYATLPVQPLQTNGSFTLAPKDLSLFVNSAEWNLASVVSTATPIQLILYIPSLDQSPLHIVGSDGNLLETNGFLIPRWGGIVIDNLKISHYQLGDLKPKMEIFVEQLRRLVGVPLIQVRPSKSIRSFPIQYLPSPSGITRMELDRLTRFRAVMNIHIASSTLISLSSLLESLENMVVQDHIQSLVLESLDNIGKAKSAWERQEYEEASLFASRAVTNSESAFYDPSMLPLLYFPDEHRFAVYMPFFVPVGVPLVVALLKEIYRAVHARKLKRD